jgi:hypothetical protein
LAYYKSFLDKEMSNQKHPIHSLFKFNAESRESKCMVSGCRDSLKGKNTTNLIRHAEKKHLEEYVHLMAAHNKNKAQPNTKKTVRSVSTELPIS